MTAADKAKLDGLPPTSTRDFAAFWDIPAAQVAAAITHLRTAGRGAAGDGGGALYRRVGSEPGHGFKVQSADGAWWEGVPDREGVSVHQFGAVGDDSTNDTSAVQAALDYAVGQGVTVWLHRGKTYRVSNLSMTSEQGFTMRAAAPIGTQNTGAGAAVLAYYGTGGSTLLYLNGVVRGLIEGISFKYGSAAPDAYIKTDYQSGFPATSIRLSEVFFYGNGKSDGSIGFDMGPNSSTNDSDHDWGRVEFRNIQTGWKFNHSQNVGYLADYIRAVGCGTAIDIAAGGNLKINTLNCTDNDLDVKMRGGGITAGTLTIDNAHVEQTTTNASAVFLDVAATGNNPITVVLNNPIVQNNYTGTSIKISNATTVVVNGGHITDASTISLTGGEDTGDSVYLQFGGFFGGTFSANDWAYYAHHNPNIGVAGGYGDFGLSGFTPQRSGRGLGHSVLKLPVAQKFFFTMPLHRPSGFTVARSLPSDAIVTAVDLVVEGTGSAAASEKLELLIGEVSVGLIAAGTAGPRHFGWAANDLDGADTDRKPLGDTSVLTALDTTHHVKITYSAGSMTNIRTITGQMYVEYVREGVEATGLDV